jgi:superfamily II DNA or RNA helicase
MSENPKKKPLIIQSSSDDEPSIPSEQISIENPVLTNKSEPEKSLTSIQLPTSSSVPSTSSSVPSTSTSVSSTSSSVPSTSTGITGSDITSSLDKNQLQDEFERLNCNDENFFTGDCNKFLLKKELVEREYLSEHEDDNNYLYPNLNDKEFNIKIATKKEFNDTKYDGTIYDDIKKQADILAKADFELQPHQAFVKNFMSFQTPYSSLLLYHGLGSGKTCSAIGVCEEMRDYMKQMGITKRIIIVASENVQDNFKLQLFDERKLKEVNGIWSMRGCIGNKLLKEINPMNMPMPKEKVVSQIKNLINTYYIFLGYVQFANYIIKTMNYEEEVKKKFERRKKGEPINKLGEKREKTKIEILKDVKVELNSRVIRRLRNEFDNRLIVIDEVHNIRKTDDNENKKVAINLEFLVKAAENMRFLLLSATPMYNNYKEIVWLLNLMNTNDRRGRIEVRDIFDKNGNFKKNGEELLIRKATGYISFVRGENPYTFPYRVYPNEFAPENTFQQIKYPSYQMNLKKIGHEDKKRILSLYLTKIGECSNCGKCQYCCYKYIIYNLRNKKFTITTKQGVIREMPSFENMESFGYTMLQTPLEALIISYPVPGLNELLDKIPAPKLSEEISPSFSESSSTKEEEEEEESVSPVKNKPKLLIVESSSSDRKSAGEEEGEVSEQEDIEEPEQDIKSSSEEYVLPSKKKPLIIEDSDDETDEVLREKRDVLEREISKKNSDDDVEELMREKNRKEKQTFKSKPKGLIIESSSDKSKTPKDDISVVSSPEKLISNKSLPSNSEGISEESKSSYEPDLNIVQRSHQGLGTSRGGVKSSLSEKDRTFSIDPHQLTGKIGLERMMNFLDSKSPPIKGDFEYKATTLKNYGKIFSQKEIGNYSAKIKCILDKIYNPESKRVSDGIILIYSQYIDSGLIPVALALEEMGFTRFGQQGIKPLFKNKPTEIVDVKTMEPPEDKKNFRPARYAMITGDPRLSPNNDFEVKGLTGEDNKDGNKVKVVLISKAGSEGIDLKFIRQVHIIDPWYNMNRPEQIIGRAVRNFSHKDLPFEKRNVEIFMYGTILDDNTEEAADLYVYRVAEYKAIQIGKVTRVLKETAVDCLINHDQTNFTQTIMSASLKEPITQELSTGEILKSFKVGDSPFSPSCDYMASCNYNCRPDSDIDESKLNEDTYDENFIVMNSEKILQRIRMLFKEAFFYKKDMLLKSIRTPKEYPFVQIYSALTQLIEDENEFIVDRYGRNGRLVNIGEYYLFQPVELKDKNISIYDRSVPIDFKHDMVNFELKQNIVKPVIDKRNLSKIVIQEEGMEFPEGKRVIDDMKVNYDVAKSYLGEKKVDRGDDNWYKHCGIVITKMSKEYKESQKYLLQFLVDHMIELLLFDDKINLMNYIYSLDSISKDSLERNIKNYFEQNSITTKDFTAFITYNLNKRMIMILDNKNKWIAARSEDQREIAAAPETKEFLAFNPSDYNTIVGFIGYEKGNKHLAFKTKNMNSKRDTGARCDQATKNKNLTKLNEIIGEQKYTIESTKAIKDEDGNIIQEAMGNLELCVLEEFLLRFFNEHPKNGKDGKKWFLTPEMAIWHKLYTVFV